MLEGRPILSGACWIALIDLFEQAHDDKIVVLAIEKARPALAALLDKTKLGVDSMGALIGGKDLEFDSFDSFGERVIDRRLQEPLAKTESAVAWQETDAEVAAMAHPRLLVPDDVAPADDHPFADGIELAVPFLDEVGDESACHFQRRSFGEEQVAAFPRDIVEGSPEQLCSIDRCRNNFDFHFRAPGTGYQLSG